MLILYVALGALGVGLLYVLSVYIAQNKKRYY